MSQNLLFRNENAASDLSATNWTAIKAVSNDDGMVFISDDTVASIARLLENVELANGQTVTTFHDEEDMYPAYVEAFGPALLPTLLQDQVRDRLAAGENGTQAVRLFNEVIRLGLQIGLSGKEFCAAHIKGVNWVGDEVTLNLSSGSMASLVKDDLSIEVELDENGSGEVTLAAFAEAVNDNGIFSRFKPRLDQFVACAQRNGATHVYWA